MKMKQAFKWFIKQFGILSKDQRKVINEQVVLIKKIAENEVDIHRRNEYNREETSNHICPKCKNTNIVNKIARVQGEGHVGGSFFGVYGESSTDTNAINHCNNCGNQWKKYETNYKYSRDIIYDWTYYLNRFREDKVYYVSFDEKFAKLKDFYAESIWQVLNSYSNCIYYTEKFGIDFLRTKFKSIYD